MLSLTCLLASSVLTLGSAQLRGGATDVSRNVMEPSVDLGTAGDFAILAKSGISTVPASVITGDIGVSPIEAEAMTGFSMKLAIDGKSATSDQTGTYKAYAASYIAPTPVKMTTAVSDMETAYTDAAGRPNADKARINLGGGILGGVNPGGQTTPLTPGVYTFSTDVKINGHLFISGLATDIFIIQVSNNVIVAANYRVELAGGVLAKNIVWQVAGNVEVGAGAHMEGVILAKTKVDFLTGSSLNGRILSQTAANLQVATINSL